MLCIDILYIKCNNYAIHKFAMHGSVTYSAVLITNNNILADRWREEHRYRLDEHNVAINLRPALKKTLFLENL